MKILYKNKVPVYFISRLQSGKITLLVLFFCIWILAVFWTTIISRYNHPDITIPVYIPATIFGLLILLGISVRLGFLETGAETDLERKRFRTFRGRAIRFGKWRSIPDFDYLYITKTVGRNNSKTLMKRSIFSKPEPVFFYDLNMITKDTPDVLIYSDPSRELILNIAKALSSAYHLKMVERTIDGDIELIY